MSKTTRRDFLKTASASALVAGAAGDAFSAEREPQQTVSPNDRIQIALIGAGGQGSSDTNVALRTGGVEVVAVADIYDGRLARAKEVWGKDVFTTRDYREVLARTDVDAVIIATPDHWHQQISIDAMNAGKDVYCEKPMVQLIEEGHRVIETEQKTKRILQVGSQRVSSVIYHKAKELLASGIIGELNLVEAWINRRSPIAAWQYTLPTDASPQTIDWDRFLGRAPKVPFEPVRLFRWRNYRDYGTGIGGDLFVHLFSGLHVIVGANGPSRVLATGGLRYWKDGRDVPDLLLGIMDYAGAGGHAGFNVALRVNFADGSVPPNQFEESGFRFVGDEGVLSIGNGVKVQKMTRPKGYGLSIDTYPKAMQDAILKEYREKFADDRRQIQNVKEETWLPPSGYSDSFDHFTNFFESVRTRKPSIEDATFGFRAAGPALLVNLSYFEGRAVNWDPERMKLLKGGEGR
jgi:predicted dehydrogenase